MSGHSKWNNIKRKKEKTDGARAKIFTKIGRELAVAVKEGGSADPAANSKLKDVIAKAKANNVPNDNIERIIKKAAGEGNSNAYESITYEGYGPAGVAVIVECLTDNRNRTAGDVRHYFDTVMSDALEAGASDFQADEDVFEIYTEPSDFSGVRDDLEAKGYSFVSAEVEMVPDTYTDLTDPDQILKMQKLIDALEDNDDVQQVWHNWNEPEEEDED